MTSTRIHNLALQSLCYKLRRLSSALYNLRHGRLVGAAAVLPDGLFRRVLIALEPLDLFRAHQARNQIRLDLLELEAEALVRVVLLIGLVLLVRVYIMIDE